MLQSWAARKNGDGGQYLYRPPIMQPRCLLLARVWEWGARVDPATKLKNILPTAEG
jgi:hypothetical protein